MAKTAFTVVATVATAPKASNAPDKRPFVRLISTHGGYINLWPKANDEKAAKMVGTLKADTTYVFGNVALHDENVVLYADSTISIAKA